MGPGLRKALVLQTSPVVHERTGIEILLEEIEDANSYDSETSS